MKLYDFQKKAIDDAINLLNTQKKCIFNLDMGLGKTICSIIIAINQLKTNQVDNILIVAPKNKQDDFKQIIKNHSQKDKFNITTYQKMINQPIFLQNAKANRTLLIVDEAQAYKNFVAKRTKFMLKNIHFFKQILLMSGNLISNGFVNLYPIYLMLKLTDINFNSFLDRYCFLTKINNHIRIIRAYKSNIENFVKLGQNITITIKTNQTNLKLPKQIEHIVKIDDKNINQLIKQTKQTQLLFNQTLLNTPQTHSAIKFLSAGYWYDQTKKTFKNTPKNIKLDHLLSMIENNDNNIVIFTNFVYERELIITSIKQKFDYINIINHNPKKQLINQLATDYQPNQQNIFIANIQSAGTGIDGLQNYHFFYCIYYTLPNSYENFEQSKKRIHRINQSKTCHYYYLIGNIYDNHVFQSLQKKQDYTLKTFELLQ